MMEEMVRKTNSWYCFVYSSWISDKDRTGIGWMLVDQRGTRIMKGSTSIGPVASPLEAEAFALREVVQQI